jgi:ADP-ribose pyrophosphatase
MEKWKIKESELMLNNKWIRVRRDTCVLPSGQIIDDYYLWEGNHFVMVFGLTKNEQVVLVRQYKHGAQDIVVELPAGVIDDSDDDPLAAAVRELREETGYEAEAYTCLAKLFIASAKATTIAYLYLATGLELVTSPQPDSQETIESLHVSLPELVQMIDAGEILDVNSVATTFLALRKLDRLKIKSYGESQANRH